MVSGPVSVRCELSRSVGGSAGADLVAASALTMRPFASYGSFWDPLASYVGSWGDSSNAQEEASRTPRAFRLPTSTPGYFTRAQPSRERLTSPSKREAGWLFRGREGFDPYSLLVWSSESLAVPN